jgi:hypothetical protein
MGERPEPRFEVRVKEGPAHGGLYELEQTTWYRVVDTRTDAVVMTFQGEMEASLSTETGMWGDHRYSGVCEVALTPDGRSVHVRYHAGREETLPLPS